MPESEALARERVLSLAEAVLARYEAELVDLELKKGRTQLVRLTVDRAGGIDLETCARVSEELSRMLDADDPIQGRYTLEVTSPGADRPLRTEKDFRKNLGRTLRVNSRDGKEHDATLNEVQQDRIKVGEEWIELNEIVVAKVVLPW
ncbi:MAG: ribosome maturation factor RimP [Actinomycetota bacterium]